MSTLSSSLESRWQRTLREVQYLESESGKNLPNVYFAKVDGKKREPVAGVVQAGGDIDMGGPPG